MSPPELIYAVSKFQRGYQTLNMFLYKLLKTAYVEVLWNVLEFNPHAKECMVSCVHNA